MAQKEVTVKITTDVDKSNVEDLEETLKKMQDTTVNVPLEVNSEELENVNEQIDDTKSQLNDLIGKVDIDKSEIEVLESELNELNTQLLELEANPSVNDSEIENLISQISDVENSLNTLEASVIVDNSEIQELESTLDVLESKQIELMIDADSSSIDDAEDKVDSLAGKEVTVNVGADTTSAEESINGLEEALTAISAGAALAGMEQMVNTASNIQDSWNRLGLTFGEVTDGMKAGISSAAETTGRSGALARQYFNDMGIAGVTNSELLQQSFESLSGRAYQTGQGIESLEQKMKMMVMSGNAGSRQLTVLGITTEDLGRAMGVSGEEASKMFKNLSQEERLRVLTQAMGEGKKANEMYKNSWQGLKEQVDKATAGLMGAIGSAILPILIPVMKAAADIVNFLSDAFKKLPEPIRAVIGIVGALTMGFLAYTTIMGAMKALNIGGIFTDLISVLKGVTMAQLASNAAALMNPYVLIALAVMGLIAALWYLYNTCKPVKEAFDHVGQALGRLWDKLSSALKPAIDAIINAWNRFMKALGVDGGNIFDAVIFFIVAFAEGLVLIIDNITELIGFVQQLYGELEKLYNDLQRLVNGDWHVVAEYAQKGVDIGVDTVGNLANNDISRSIFSGLFGDEALAQADAEMPGFLENIKTKLHEGMSAFWDDGTQGFLGWLGQISGIDIMPYLQGVWNGFMQIPTWINQISQQTIQTMQGWVSNLGGIFNNAISNTVSFGSSLISNLGGAARNAVSSFANGINNLGRALRDELNGMLNDAANFVGEIGQTMWNAAVTAWNNFLSGLQRHSPGKMMREFEMEMSGIVQYAKDAKEPLGSAMRDVGANAVVSFNPDIDFDGVNDITSSVRNIKLSFASGMVNAARGELNNVLDAINDFGRQSVEAAKGIGQNITNAMWQRNNLEINEQLNGRLETTLATMQNWRDSITGIFNNVLSIVGNFGVNLASSITFAVQQAFDAFVNVILDMWAHIVGGINVLEFTIEFNAKNYGENITSSIRSATQQVMDDFMNIIPDIWTHMVAEINGPDFTIGDNAKMIPTLNNPNLNVNTDDSKDSASNIVNNEFNFVINGDVDNDERMKRFADYIIELMNWDNNTAGRTG